MHQNMTTYTRTAEDERIISELITRGYAYVKAGSALPREVSDRLVRGGTRNTEGFNKQWANGFQRQAVSCYGDIIYRPGDQRLWGRCIGNFHIQPMDQAHGWEPW